jgi:ParB-like chromosome segregation protein Spo0J
MINMKKKINISKVKPNAVNPRYIKDHKFKKLVKSIKSFPEMLEKRPIIVDENMIVLGGNMRLKASIEAGLKEVWIDIAEGWSEDQKKEFIIKDNVGFGEWDWDILANEWDAESLNEWGLEVPLTEDDIEEMGNPNNIDTENIFATELDRQSNYIVLKFDTDIDWLQAKTVFGLRTETGRRANGKEWSKGIGRVLNGTNAINKLMNEN